MLKLWALGLRNKTLKVMKHYAQRMLKVAI
jgi:hypothetical protein